MSEKFSEAGRSVGDQLADAGIRVEVDERNEKLGYRIREAQLAKVPYMLVVGAREAEAGGAALRLRTGEDLGTLPVPQIAERISACVRERSSQL